jgi:hypothetical protein
MWGLDFGRKSVVGFMDWQNIGSEKVNFVNLVRNQYVIINYVSEETGNRIFNIIVVIHHKLGLNRPVLALSNSPFKRLPSCLHLFGL